LAVTPVTGPSNKFLHIFIFYLIGPSIWLPPNGLRNLCSFLLFLFLWPGLKNSAAKRWPIGHPGQEKNKKRKEIWMHQAGPFNGHRFSISLIGIQNKFLYISLIISLYGPDHTLVCTFVCLWQSGPIKEK
jgi:hypothetical protein